MSQIMNMPSSSSEQVVEIEKTGDSMIKVPSPPEYYDHVFDDNLSPEERRVSTKMAIKHMLNMDSFEVAYNSSERNLITQEMDNDTYLDNAIESLEDQVMPRHHLGAEAARSLLETRQARDEANSQDEAQEYGDYTTDRVLSQIGRDRSVDIKFGNRFDSQVRVRELHELLTSDDSYSLQPSIRLENGERVVPAINPEGFTLEKMATDQYDQGQRYTEPITPEEATEMARLAEIKKVSYIDRLSRDVSYSEQIRDSVDRVLSEF